MNNTPTSPLRRLGLRLVSSACALLSVCIVAALAAPNRAVAAPLPTQTLTILGGSGNAGDVAANVEYYNPATSNWQPAYLAYFPWNPTGHPWGNISGTNNWINYVANGTSDPLAGPTSANTLWYLYRVRFTVPADAINPTMTFSVKADNYVQVFINGVSTGPVIEGQANSLNADAVFSQNVHPGENTITLNVGDYGGLNGFNFRIDLSMQSSQPLVIVPAVPADTTPPIIAAPSALTAEATSAAGAAVTFTATANDAVSGPVNVVASPASGSTFPLGVNSVGLAAADAAGNTATASFTVTVRDTTPPVISGVPTNIVAEAANVNGTTVVFANATASDLVDGSVPVIATPGSGGQFALGNTTVNLKATDAHSNSASASFTVTVRDTIAPSLIAPANQILEATSAGGAIASFSATATDAVGVASLTYSKASGTLFPIGTTTVTVNAADAAGNAAVAKTFTVTVRDTIAPVITSVSGNLVIEAAGSTGTVVNYTAAVAADAVGVTSLTYSQASGTLFAIGTATVTVNAADAAGNTAVAKTFTVTVRDTTKPTLSLPANLTVEATSAAGAVATFTASAADAVGVTSFATSAASGATFPIGTTTVSATAKDAAGNTATGSFTITVRDTTKPTVTATMTPRGGGDDESSQFFILAFSAKDAVGVKTLAASLNGVAVASGQVVQLQISKSGAQSVKRDDGKLQIKATSFLLTVTATDAAGNTTTSIVVPVFVKNGKDSEDKKDEDKKDS
jgi:hypothetical protein